MTSPRDLLREIPSIDRLLQEPEVTGLLALYPREAVVEALRQAVADLRERILAGGAAEPLLSLEPVARALADRFRLPMRAVVNATGVVLHTNLGRALLGPEAVEAVTRAAARYVNLEFDTDSGERGHRSDHVAPLLCELTGAEAACVVNNNAASMLLILDELARGGEVVVARSELIEIGGSFRLPEVLERSGARIVEVGTTNKTYLRDYARAITPDTKLLLKTHPSNYRIVGFTAEVALADLAALGCARGIPTAMDLGSGVMVDLAPWGLPREPTVAECVASGVDLVCFSGDKLLGGPQAGVILGRAALVERCARNPLMRALRCDKLTLAALQATLAIYRYPERIPEAVPALEMLSRPLDRLEAAARALADALRDPLRGLALVEAIPGRSLPGGGSLPACELPTWLTSVTLLQGGETAWSERLRRADPPIIGRTEGGRILLDVRTLRAGDDVHIVSAFLALAGGS